MLKALIVDEDNLDRCRELLNVYNIPQRCVDEPTWLIWGNVEWPEVKLLPHAVFRDRYVVVGHEEENMLVEKL